MKTILVADGDNGIRNIVRLLFTEKMGYRVVAVSKGTDAVLKAKEIIPDIVLADAYLSNKDGYQVAREIKSDPFLRATHVVLLNSAFATLNKKKALKARVDGVIIKPFGPEIVEKVGSLLNYNETRRIKLVPIIHAWEMSKIYAAKLATVYGRVGEGTKSTYRKSFAVMVQTIALNMKGTYRLASAFAENLKATILRNIKAVTKSLRVPSVQIPISKYVAEFKMVYNSLVLQTKQDYSKSFNSIAQTATERIKNYCQPARKFTVNFKTTMGKLMHLKTPTRMLKTNSFSFPSAEVLRGNYVAKFAIVYNTLVEQTKYNYSKYYKIINQSVAKHLKDYRQAARGFMGTFRATMEKLDDIKTPNQILMIKSLSFLSVEVLIRKYCAKFEIVYNALVLHKKYDYSKSFRITTQSVFKHLKDYSQAAKGFTGNFRAAMGRFREIKIWPQILTARSLEPSLGPLFFTRLSLISLIGMGIILSITTLITPSNRKLEGTSSFFNTSKSTTEFAESESEAGIKENNEPSRQKQKSRGKSRVAKNEEDYSLKPERRGNNRKGKIRHKSGYKYRPQKDLEEVLKGAFLLQ